MKIKKQFLQISVAAFVLSLVRIIIGAVFSLITRAMFLDMYDYQGVIFLNYVNVGVSYAIIPVLIFAVFYFIGKKPDLTLELRPILLALLIGNIASFFIGSIVYSAIVMEITVGNISVHMLQSMMTFLVAEFLAALAGLSIGHIRRNKLTVSAEPELK